MSVILQTMQAQETPTTDNRLPPCDERPAIFDLPRTGGIFWCPEQVTAGDEALLYTSLTVDNTGRLYATNPARGEVVYFVDAQYDDRLPDTPELLVDGLRAPNALHWYQPENDTDNENALYIAGDGILYRWQNNTLQTLRDDLPAGRGALIHGLTVHDSRVYVGIPAPCDDCVLDTDLAGTVVSMALDGSDLQVEARGLRFPAALTVYDGLLWVSDTASSDAGGQILDELNQIDLTADAVPHFGWPYCIGLDNQPARQSDFNCETATAPAYGLHTGSVPLALEPYTAELFPHLRDELLLVLAGAADSAFITGYEVVSLETWHRNNATVFEVLLPLDSLLTGTDRVRYDPSRGYRSKHGTLLNRRGAGTWPLHPYDVAVSPAGWLYISAGSEIYALRPAYRDDDICIVTVCRSDAQNESRRSSR